MEESFSKLKSLIEEQMNFPDTYMFKFITKQEKKGDLLSVLESHEIFEKESANGKYISITSKKRVSTSSEVIDVYLEASKIEGIITL